MIHIDKGYFKVKGPQDVILGELASTISGIKEYMLTRDFTEDEVMEILSKVIAVGLEDEDTAEHMAREKAAEEIMTVSPEKLAKICEILAEDED